MDSANTGELVALALKRAGVSHLFTLNGGHIWPILTGATEHGIRIIDVRHEQSAAFAAEGWAKVTRQVGVAAVTAGPGVTNAATALAQAQSGDSPIFVIGGRAPASMPTIDSALSAAPAMEKLSSVSGWPGCWWSSFSTG